MGRPVWLLLAASLLLGVTAVGGQSGPVSTTCGQAVDKDCRSVFETKLQGDSASTSAICRAADVMLGCAAPILASCDVIEAAQTVDEVRNQVILPYLNDCTLTNASLPVYDQDACKDGLALCFGVLDGAQAASQSFGQGLDETTVCIYLDGFKRCIKNELQTCNASVLQSVDQRAENAGLQFNTNFSCGERQGEVVFRQCMQRLNSRLGVLPRDLLCREYADSQDCVEAAKSQANGTEQAASFGKQLDEETEFLLQAPYFCQAENPCLEAVVQCNQTSSATVQEQCDLVKVYDGCLSDALQQCDNGYHQATIDQVNVLKTKLADEHQCEISSGVSDLTCDDVATTCSQQLTAEITKANGDQNATCRSVDGLLECIVKGSDVCDVVAKADLISVVQPLIRSYSQPDSNCDLKNKDLPQLQLDECDRAIVNCSGILFQAESFDPTNAEGVKAACNDYGTFNSCVQQTLGDCDDTRLQAVNIYSSDASDRFAGRPYFCQERGLYDLAAADAKSTSCHDDFMMAMGSTVDVNLVCSALSVYATCLDTAKALASPRQVAQFDAELAHTQSFYSADPFFCLSENPCMDRYRQCVKDLYKEQVQQPCDALDVMDSCLTYTETRCQPDKLTTTTDIVRQERNQADQENGCSLPPSATEPTATITTQTPTETTTTPTTTTASPTPPATTPQPPNGKDDASQNGNKDAPPRNDEDIPPQGGKDTPPQDNTDNMKDMSSQDNKDVKDMPVEDNNDVKDTPPQDNKDMKDSSSHDNEDMTDMPPKDNETMKDMPPEDNTYMNDMPPENITDMKDMPPQDNKDTKEMPPEDMKEMPPQDNKDMKDMLPQDNKDMPPQNTGDAAVANEDMSPPDSGDMSTDGDGGSDATPTPAPTPPATTAAPSSREGGVSDRQGSQASRIHPMLGAILALTTFVIWLT